MAIYTSRVLVDLVSWGTTTLDYQRGRGGSSRRGVVWQWGDRAIWWSHAADTPAGVVQTGYNPGDFPSTFPETDGRTMVEIPLPAGRRTAAQHAATLEATLLAQDGVEAVTLESVRSDGRIQVVIRSDAPITGGLRAWADRGACGPWGSPVHRRTRGGDSPLVTPTLQAAPHAQAINAPPADAIVYAFQLPLGSTVSTDSTGRPRMVWRYEAVATTTALNSVVLFDAGQLPASEVVADRIATIWLTPAQCLALRQALSGVSGGRHWFSAHSSASETHVLVYPRASGELGQLENLDVRFHNAAVAGSAASPTTWGNGGSAASLVGGRVLFEVDPASDDERIRTWGTDPEFLTVRPPATPGLVLFTPINNSEVCTSGEGDESLVGDRLYGAANASVGTTRIKLHVGGSGSDDSPDYSGATRFADLGTQVGDGTAEVFFPAPSGDAVLLPDPGAGHLVIVQKAAGQGGYGETPSPHEASGRPTQATSWIRRAGASVGGTTYQQDRTGTGATGDAANADNATLQGTRTVTDNCPWLRLYTRILPFSAELVSVEYPATDTHASEDDVTAAIELLRGSGAAVGVTRTRIDTTTDQAISLVPSSEKRGALAVLGFVSADAEATIEFYDGDPGDGGELLADHVLQPGAAFPFSIAGLASSAGRALWITVSDSVQIRGTVVSIEV